MLIIAGVKEKRKRLGYAVDFCLYCRDLREVRVFKLQMMKHFYFINYRSDSEPWFEQKCLICGGKELTDIATYSELLKKPSPRLEEVIKKAYPDIYKDYRDRLTLEKEVVRAPLGIDGETRLMLIKEPFQALAPQIESVYTTATHLDKHILLSGSIGIFVSLGTLIHAGESPAGPQQDTLFILAYTVCAVSLVTLIYFWAFASRRRIKKQLMPLFVRALKPLKPKAKELDQIESFYRITKAKVGKKWIFKALHHNLIETKLGLGSTPAEFKNVNALKGDYVKAMRKKP